MGIVNFQKLYFNLFPGKLLPVSEFLQTVMPWKYVLLKLDVPYMPLDFPAHYPIGKDLDILVCPEDYLSLKSNAIEFIAASGWPYETKVVDTDNNTRIRFLWSQRLHYQIDITRDIGNNRLSADMIKFRVRENNYYIPEKRFEIFYRALQFKNKKRKMHHLEYIKNNIQEWSDKLARKYEIDIPKGV